MSKKKQPPRMAEKKEDFEIVKLPENKVPVKKIIIAAAAILLAAAIVLTVVFVVKPSLDNGKTTTPQTTAGSAPGTDGYELVDYKGVSMAKEFVDILNQAEKDKEAACKEYGVAVTIGDIKISYPEFLAYYYDRHSAKKQETLELEENGSSYSTGYDLEKLPDEQDCLNKGYTWAEEFTRDAITALQEDYEGFDKAIEAKVTLNESEIAQLISDYSRIEIYSSVQNKTYEELFAEVYTASYTEAMFKAREIMLVYKQKYRQMAIEEIAAGYSNEYLEEALKGNESDYTVIKGRIYPIEGEYNAVEVSKINTEQEFLDYANNNNPNENYVAETATICNYIDKSKISSVYGSGVAEWIFSEERVRGEIGVVEGESINFLVYIEELPYFSVSRKIMFCGYDYFEGITEVEIDNYRTEIDTLYNDWVSHGENKDEFAEICLTFNDSAEYDTRVGMFFYEFDEWIFDSERKPGDHVFIDTDVGCCMIYYVGENEDDYDWQESVRTTLSEKKFLSQHEANIAENYEPQRKESVIKKVCKEVNVTLTRKIKQSKEED